MPEKIDVGWIDPGYTNGNFTHSIAGQLRDMEYFGCAGRVIRKSMSIPIKARNKVVEEFLTLSDSPWLWLIDADMVFDKGHVQKLWLACQDHDVKMASGLAFIWTQGEAPAPSYYFLADDQEGFIDGETINIKNKIPPESCIVAATGLASSLIHRDVFEAMPVERLNDFRWFDYDRQSPGSDGVFGEDIQFFLRAKELGFDLVLEPAAETLHMKEIAVGLDDFKGVWGT